MFDGLNELLLLLFFGFGVNSSICNMKATRRITPPRFSHAVLLTVIQYLFIHLGAKRNSQVSVLSARPHFHLLTIGSKFVSFVSPLFATR